MIASYSHSLLEAALFGRRTVYVGQSASALVKVGPGELFTAIPSSQASGYRLPNVQVFDGLDESGALLFDSTGDFTIHSWSPLTLAFRVGLFVAVGAGDCTVVYA